MNLNYLMIGDWVSVLAHFLETSTEGTATSGGYNLCRKNCHIGGIYGDMIAIDKISSDAIAYEPIPLTEEILKANGFTTDNDHTLKGSCIYHRLCGKYEDYKVIVRLLNGWVKIESFDDRWHTLLDLAIQPRYVHELQHALRLCGLNELADNFKVEPSKAHIGAKINE